MLQFDRNKAAAVARETQNTFLSFDSAYLSALQLATSVLEVKRGSNLPERDGQRLMQAMHESAGNLLAGPEPQQPGRARLRMSRSRPMACDGARR